MENPSRREVLTSGGLAVAAAALPTQPARSADRPTSSVVKLFGEGLSLSPEELAGVLGQLTEGGALEPDYYSNGGAVTAMERAFARELSKERAVFFPTGTMANHAAIRMLAGEDSRVLVQERSHVYNDSGDCVQILSHLDLVPLAEDRATFAAEEVRRELRRAASGRVPRKVGVISIECPVRLKLGALFDFEEMQQVAALARENGVRLHLDGARLYIASAYTGVPVDRYAALFDTVYVSLWKCFNAPFGAVLAGPAKLLDDAFNLRRMLGGGLPYAWPAAAVAAHYLPGYHDRLRPAKDRFERLLAELERGGRFTVQRIQDGTNNAMLRWDGAPDPAALRTALAKRGVALSDPARYFRGFVITANETLARMEPAAIAAAFRAAAAEA